MTANELQAAVTTAFHKYFPNGSIRISPLALGGGVAIFCGLIGDIEDVSAKIRANDPITFRSYIHKGIKFNDSEVELQDLEVEFDGVWVTCITEKPHMYAESRKVSVRKIKGDTAKIIAGYDKYFKKLKEFVTELAAEKQIIQQDSIPEKYL